MSALRHRYGEQGDKVGEEIERLLPKQSMAPQTDDPVNRRVLPDTESYTPIVMLFLIPFGTMWVYALGGLAFSVDCFTISLTLPCFTSQE